jgi:hypothetical protein
MTKKKLTLLCVAIAGLIFIPSVIVNKPIYGLIAAFFDWLPLFTGWMRYSDEKNKTPYLHITLTLIAYAFFIVWLFIPGSAMARYGFILIWFLAVLSGTDI